METTDNFPNDYNLKQYMVCIMKRLNIIHPNNKLNEAGVFAQLESFTPEDKLLLLNLGRACISHFKSKGTDISEKLYNFFVCTKTKDPEHFMALY